MSNTAQSERLGTIITKCWADDAFKRGLLADPMTTLQTEGVDVPEGLEVRVVENTDKIFHLVLSPKPASDESSEEYFRRIAERSFGNGVWRGRAAGDSFCECCGEDMGIF